MQRTRTLLGIITLAVLFALSGISLAHEGEMHDKGGDAMKHGKKMEEGSGSKASMEGHEYRDDHGKKMEGSGGEHAGGEYKDDHRGEYKKGHHDKMEEGSGGMK